MKKIAIALCVTAVISCASKRGPAAPPAPPPIKSIAVVAGDLFSSALGAELFNQGFRTFELPMNQDLTGRALHGLAVQGIDAVLVVTSKKGLDLVPDHASIRILRTQNGATVAAFDWSNSATARKNMADSARDAIRTLLQTIPKP